MWVLSLGSSRAAAAALLAFASLSASCCPPIILTEHLPPGRVGEAYAFAFDTECWDPFWWMTGDLPVGMSFDSEGVLSGVPQYPGRYFLTVGFDDIVDGEILTSVSKAFELLIVGEDEPLPEWEPTDTDPGA